MLMAMLGPVCPVFSVVADGVFAADAADMSCCGSDCPSDQTPGAPSDVPTCCDGTDPYPMPADVPSVSPPVLIGLLDLPELLHQPGCLGSVASKPRSPPLTLQALSCRLDC